MKKRNFVNSIVTVVVAIAAILLAVCNHTLAQELEKQIPFDADKAKITGLKNCSTLEREKGRTGRFFNGTMTLCWDCIPNATGYEIEYNYTSMTYKTKTPLCRFTGGFYVFNEEKIGNEQVRVRAYCEQDDEVIYGEFSEWISLNIE